MHADLKVQTFRKIVNIFLKNFRKICLYLHDSDIEINISTSLFSSQHYLSAVK